MDNPESFKTSKATLFRVILWLLVAVVLLVLGCVYLSLRAPGAKVVYDQDIITGKVQQELRHKNMYYPDHDPLLYRSGIAELPVWGNPAEDGFRPPSIDHLGPKGYGEKRVLIVGDSNTFGMGIPDAEKIFTGILNRTARERGLKVTFFNVSAPGWNMSNSMEAISAFFGRIEPDVVIYQYTANDYYLSFYPYAGDYTTIWAYEPAINHSPFYTETDPGNMISVYSGRFPDQTRLIQSYVYHPMFRNERLRIGQRLKTVAQALAARHVPFVVFSLQPFVIGGGQVDPSLEETLVELGIDVEIWRNTATYDAPPSAPFHPDERGHRILAGELYEALRQLPMFAAWPEIPEFQQFYRTGLHRYLSPGQLEGRYRDVMAGFAAEAPAMLQPRVSFESGREQGVFQVNGRITTDGLAGSMIALALPPSGGQPLEIRYRTPDSPLVAATPLRLRAYTQTGTFFQDQLVQKVGENSFKVALDAKTPFVLELDFGGVYYDPEREAPYAAALESIGFAEAPLLHRDRVAAGLRSDAHPEGWVANGVGSTESDGGVRVDQKADPYSYAYHDVPVPAGAWKIQGDVAVRAAQPKAVVLVDLVWLKQGRETARHTATLEATDAGTRTLSAIQAVPGDADTLRFQVHPWRPDDGAITVGQATFSWY